VRLRLVDCGGFDSILISRVVVRSFESLVSREKDTLSAVV
jgi:hypothetical protein